jgi:hypothetical protein
MSVTTPIGIEFSPPSAHTLPEFSFLRRFTLLKMTYRIFSAARSGWRPISPGLTRLEIAAISTRPADRLTKANRLAEA